MSLKFQQKIKQKGRFDCLGCAWPNLDDARSSLAEFCENGMKEHGRRSENKTIGNTFFLKAFGK